MKGEVPAAIAFVVAAVASIALAVVYWEGGHPQAEGILLAVAFGGIGAGIVAWAKGAQRADLAEEVSEPRGLMGSTEEEREALVEEVQEGAPQVGRRRLLVASVGSALTALGVALLFPIRSLGPRPGRDLKRTPYDEHGPTRVVREDGEPVRPDDLPVDGVLTVWPEGHTDAPDAPTLLIRTRPDRDFDPREGREGWTVDGIVAYSKLCTHVGCPVGLYESDKGLLLCPCHQSTFDVYDGARPIFGPAARSLPQLPLDVDDEGYLVATGDFSDPVGPGFWDRGR